MSLNRIYSYNDYLQINDFCVKNLARITMEASSVIKKEELKYLRGNYKAYIHLKKINTRIYKNKRSMYIYELYSLIKNQKNDLGNTYRYDALYIKGIKNGMYECLNKISEM